jgi:lipopolysaccharide export system protein LptA
MKRWALAAGAALIVCVTAAQAQISGKGGPIDISADNFALDNNQKVATYKGKVELLQDQNRLRTDQLNIYFGSAPQNSGGQTAGANPLGGANWGDVDRLEAVGNVYFVTPTQTVRGDKAVYTKATDTLVVTGTVVALQGENVMKGSRLVVRVATGQTTMEGAGETGRVRGVFYPKQNQGQTR